MAFCGSARRPLLGFLQAHYSAGGGCCRCGGARHQAEWSRGRLPSRRDRRHVSTALLRPTTFSMELTTASPCVAQAVSIRWGRRRRWAEDGPAGVRFERCRSAVGYILGKSGWGPPMASASLPLSSPPLAVRLPCMQRREPLPLGRRPAPGPLRRESPPGCNEAAPGSVLQAA